MAEAKAQLNDYRQSPRKVRIVADTVRGKKVEEALNILTFIPKRAGLPLKKLIASAYANAGKAEGLVVKEIKVDTGPTLYRRRPRSRGMANPIRKRTSHVSVTLAAPTSLKLRGASKK
ncbi:MAG: 50S ribosomal protein L22 [Candidatus Zambryskibacteria bacterium RIFCSPLOWO2_12_FULL_45_14]|uniref:Large ribosomal subunit protein uL22 n=2 Tax=Candidatus Zambryskiibacteriota TaxID=1817925 RepID=A0A1G2UJW6_9BACT|nr:MAG: 50S ribosomal protein L22 [Candidatus Zambryskibacteria bacterium RIFCSPLOWO2_02_FULL_44_12b]OHB13536.1 MAG: 50S ribosomal protein L22 [Candidatus Zambryskibacteria bacterium RIFCSPLOWO2_12_FULL_45_14]